VAVDDHALEEVRLATPVSAEDAARLEIGQVVYLDGLVYTGREGLYRRVLDEGLPMPTDLGALTNVNFHCSPAAAPDGAGGYRVGAVTATASFRFSKWMASWMDAAGARVIIGKGGMSGQDYRDHFVPRGAVYLTTVGYGTGALLGTGIKSVREVHWLAELGIAQAVWVFEVERFGPFLVDGDARGNSLFEEHNRRIAASIERAYEGTRAPALRRFGETDRRTDELI
jgi:L(+)-tartrate dehydratase beta subunit